MTWGGGAQVNTKSFSGHVIDARRECVVAMGGWHAQVNTKPVKALLSPDLFFPLFLLFKHSVMLRFEGVCALDAVEGRQAKSHYT